LTIAAKSSALRAAPLLIASESIHQIDLMTRIYKLLKLIDTRSIFMRNKKGENIVTRLKSTQSDYPVIFMFVEHDFDIAAVIQKYTDLGNLSTNDMLIILYYIEDTLLPDDDYDEEKECSICLENYTKARFHPCDHSVCVSCSFTLVECPLCRKCITKKIVTDDEVAHN